MRKTGILFATTALALGFCVLLPGSRTALAGWGGGNGSCPAEDGDQVWFMGYNGPTNSTVYYRLEHRDPSHDPYGGTTCDFLSLADGLSTWWYSHPFDGSTPDGSHTMPFGSAFSGGDWEVCLTYRIGASSLEDTSIQLRVYDVADQGDTSGTLLASHDTGTMSGCTGFTCYQYGCWTLAPEAVQEVQPGHRLALQVRNHDPSLASLLQLWYECPDRCSHLIAPAGTELCTDGDGDGYGNPASTDCDFPTLDCDDTNPYIHPGQTESAFGDPMCSDGADNDCDGAVDMDDNGCQECTVGSECDDGDPCTDDTCVGYVCVYPYNTAPCDDLDACTMDDSCFQGACSGDPLDGDGDGHVSDACGGDDCDDGAAGVNPGADEACGNGIDDDCDGSTDLADPDCWACTVAGECGDYDACTTDACVDHQCEHTAVDCDDGNACTDDSCDRIQGCENACNAEDHEDPCCANYACLGSPACEEPPECTVPEDCDDDNLCTLDDCVDQACENIVVDCDDGNACTDDACDPGTGGCFNACNAQDHQDPCCANYACVGEAVCDACTDQDGDGYGNPASVDCTHPEEDCDDGAPAVNPGADEVCDNGIDDDCDGLADAADTADCPAPAWGEASTVPGSTPWNWLGVLLVPVAAWIGLRRRRRGA